MTDWAFEVSCAIRRSKGKDQGAIAAREAILGFQCSQTSQKALNIWNVAHAAREGHQGALQRRNKRPMAPGTTGNGEWDQQLKQIAEQFDHPKPLQPAENSLVLA